MVIEAEMFSDIGVCTNNSTMSPGLSVTSKLLIEIKPLLQFTEALDFKHKNYVSRLCAAK